MLTAQPVLRRSKAVHEDFVTVRAYVKEDHDAVVAIVTAGLLEYADTDGEKTSTQKYINDTFKPKLKTFEKKLEEGTLPFNLRFWVAEEKGTVIGCVGLKPTMMQPRESRKMADIYSMSVTPSHRRKGVASKLLRALEEHCADVKIEKMRLTTQDNLAPAIAFYKGHGFAQISKKPWQDLMLYKFEKEPEKPEPAPVLGKRSRGKAFS